LAYFDHIRVNLDQSGLDRHNFAKKKKTNCMEDKAVELLDSHPGFWLNPATGRFLSKSARTYNGLKRSELLDAHNITIPKKVKGSTSTPQAAPAPEVPPAAGLPDPHTVSSVVPPAPQETKPKPPLTHAERVALFWKQNGY
jgi:hypothetical protein